ncbi:MAG: AI-2E family transporter [Micropruina sp.]|nr:AI-2E family transporter [Micropruina sp.]
MDHPTDHLGQRLSRSDRLLCGLDRILHRSLLRRVGDRPDRHLLLPLRGPADLGAAVSFLPERYQEPTARAGQGGWGSLVSYMRAQVLVCLVDAAGVALVAQILGLPMVLALFVITFFLSFIPVVGAFVAGSLAVLLALVTNGWVAALIMLGGTVLVMWSESHFLQPLLLGRAVSLHPLAVLLALVMGAEVAGIVGALLVIPTLAFVVSFLRSLRGESTTPSDRHE